MQLEHSSIESLKKQILDIVGKHVNLKKYRVFVFGSRVTGENRETSDIDIGIEGPKPLDLAILAQIRGEMEELQTLYTIDVVDFKSAAPGFKKEVSAHREFLTISDNA